MKRVLLVAFLTVGFYAITNAQSKNMGSSYQTAIGVKGYFGDGSLGGFNVKHFFESNKAVEGSLLFRNKVLLLEGLYEWHGDIRDVKGLKWYAGPGAWLGSSYSSFVLAARGTVGLDYKFDGAPIAISFDVNPTLTLTPSSSFDFFAGIAFKFAL